MENDTHRKLPYTIAVDFDDTLVTDNYPDVGEIIFENWKKVLKAKEAGAKIVLWTCRTDEPLKKAVEFCKEHGLVFDAVNENIEEAKKFYNNDPRKIFADEYWDDRSIGNFCKYNYPLTEKDRIEEVIKPFTREIKKDNFDSNLLFVSSSDNKQIGTLRDCFFGEIKEIDNKNFGAEKEIVISFIKEQMTEKNISIEGNSLSIKRKNLCFLSKTLEEEWETTVQFLKDKRKTQILIKEQGIRGISLLFEENKKEIMEIQILF